jgi:Flp pilus assembly protein TadG
MRWLSHFLGRLNDERGATAVIVAISMTALIGLAAFAIDFGALYGERRELQSGADAGALAIAEDCALGEPCTAGTANATAASYASSNANDGTAGIESVELNTAAREVTVSTKTRDTSGSDVYKPFLAQVLGFNGTTVNAEATAVWGYPQGLNTIPLIISDCEWLNPGITEPPTTINLRFHNSHPDHDCPVGPAGHDADGDGRLPGAFGWLNGSTNCNVSLDQGTWIDGDPGNGVPNDCRSVLSSLLNTTVLIPFFDDVIKCDGAEPACPPLGLPNGKWYRVAGFGAFRLLGYQFPGNNGGENCGGNSCIRGYFTTASDPDGELGGPNRGVVVVKLTK